MKLGRSFAPRGRISRNMVSVGEPADGSLVWTGLQRISALACSLFSGLACSITFYDQIFRAFSTT